MVSTLSRSVGVAYGHRSDRNDIGQRYLHGGREVVPRLDPIVAGGGDEQRAILETLEHRIELATRCAA